MTPAEAQVLLSMAATVDNRKPDADAAKAWAAMLDGLRLEDCIAAVRDHFMESDEWLTPAKIRTRVKRIRAKRIEEHPKPTPPPDMTPIETNRWRREMNQHIGDGEHIDFDAAYGELKPRNLGELPAAMQALMPRPDDEPETTEDGAA